MVSKEPEYFIHSTIAPPRCEKIPQFVKQNKSSIVTRIFKKNQSVFRDWREDDDKKLETCVEHDF